MAMTAQEINTLLEGAMPDAKISILDTGGDGEHYAVTVTSESFRGKSRVQQHQMVYQALGGRMGGQLHALAVTTKIPD